MIEAVIFGSVVLCIMVALLMYWSVAPFIVKLLTLPFAIGFSLYTIWTTVALLGSPINGFPPEFRYVHHEITNGGKGIALWVYTEAHEDYRLYVFPYNRENAKKLQKAQQSKKQGKPVDGKFKKKKDKKEGLELVLTPGKPIKQHRPPKDQGN